MKLSYVGQTPVYKHAARVFRACDAVASELLTLEWAENILKQAPRIFPNGRDSHVVANEAIAEAEDKLIDYLMVVA